MATLKATVAKTAVSPPWYDTYRKGLIAAVFFAGELINEGVLDGTVATVIRCLIATAAIVGVTAIPNVYPKTK